MHGFEEKHHGPTRLDAVVSRFDTVAAWLNAPAARLMHHRHGSSHSLHGYA